MSTRHLPVSRTMELGQSSVPKRRTGASAVTRPSLAQRALGTVGAALRNFAGLEDRPAAVVKLHAA